MAQLQTVLPTQPVILFHLNLDGVNAGYDNKRFRRYLAEVEAGNVKIAGACRKTRSRSAKFDEVANPQWKRMGRLPGRASSTNAFARRRVSAKMSSLPMDVCVSLGLLLSELCDEPWHHRVITFNMRPQLHHVAGDTLWDKARSSKMDRQI
ncbi:hypothetical protein ZWY2020_036370 [Hordeum vulgare]|nr:hypothetical protein ZWY2020_036370 [Hordeum vulgare]